MEYSWLPWSTLASIAVITSALHSEITTARIYNGHSNKHNTFITLQSNKTKHKFWYFQQLYALHIKITSQKNTHLICLPIVIWTNYSVLIICLYFMLLHILMKTAFGILYLPISMQISSEVSFFRLQNTQYWPFILHSLFMWSFSSGQYSSMRYMHYFMILT